MMKYLGVFIIVSTLFGASSLPSAQAQKSVEKTRYDEARPPIRIHKAATASPTGYTPTQIRHAYGFDTLAADGSGQIIGIVNAFDAPTVASDLKTFSNQYGLTQMHGLTPRDPCTVATGPHPCFQKVFASGSRPRADSGWALESALDVEWSHVVAPEADILLVESKNNTFANLLGAVDVAVGRGAKVISMSWGGGEFSTENAYDFHFQVPGVMFTAASGDSGTGALYPSVSPNVLSVGGTTLPLDSAGNMTGVEKAWSGSGGGISSYENEPGYQVAYPVPSTDNKRGAPDVSYNADPATGFSVYYSYQSRRGWFQVGGTSAGAPQWAGIIALANQNRSNPLSLSSNLDASPLYTAATIATNYRDITVGTNGSCRSICTAGIGYDFVTGLGSPRANNLVPSLTTQ